MVTLLRRGRPVRFPVTSRLPGLLYDLVARRERLPAEVAQLLVVLGPAFAKVGQVLSARVDALPPHWIRELARLRDGIPAEHPVAVAEILAQAFPDGVASVLHDLSTEPIAAGTVAQVHTARLADGQKVAVKILRPGVAQRLEGNFRLLFLVADLAQRVSRSARVLNVRGLVDELHELLLSQTDLSVEARNFRRFAREFADNDLIRIPRVFSRLSSPNVLVTEFVDAIGPYDFDRMDVDRTTLARRVDDLLDEMVYVSGLCHADLHPGNFFWTSDGRIVLIDLGLVHELSPEERRHLLTFYFAVLDGFAEFAAAYALRHLTRPAKANVDEGGASSAAVPPGAFDDVTEVVRTHWIDTGGAPAFSRMFADFLGALGRHGLQLRHRFSRLFLTLATVEGYEFSLDPDFEPAENGRRKRVEQVEYTGIPPAADALVFEGVATYSTAMFGDGRAPAEAWAERDRFVLDALDLGPGTSFLDVGCGRGQLLAAAEQRGAKAVGITVSEKEHQLCTARGLDVVLSSWENADRRFDGRTGVFDAMAAVEMDAHLGTLHENRIGLLDLRLDRFFAWARRHLTPDGRLFVQSVTVTEQLLHDAGQEDEYRRLIEALPWIGFSTFPQLVRCSDPYFRLEQALDHSSDLQPTFEFWRDNVNRHLAELREVVPDRTIVLVRRQLDTVTRMAEEGRLGLYRLLFRARDGAVPPGTTQRDG